MPCSDCEDTQFGDAVRDKGNDCHSFAGTGVHDEIIVACVHVLQLQCIAQVLDPMWRELRLDCPPSDHRKSRGLASGTKQCSADSSMPKFHTLYDQSFRSKCWARSCYPHFLPFFPACALPGILRAMLD